MKFRTSDADASEPPRLVSSLRQLALTFFAMAQTRLALAGLEIEETLQWLTALVLRFLGLLVFAWVGILSVTLLVVLAADPAKRVLVLAGFVVLYLGLAGWFWLQIKRVLTSRPPFLQATLSAMADDRDALLAATSPEAANNSSNRSSP